LTLAENRHGRSVTVWFATDCKACPLADFALGCTNVDATLESTDRPTATELSILSVTVWFVEDCKVCPLADFALVV